MKNDSFSDDSIIDNDNCIPDENEINEQLRLYNKKKEEEKKIQSQSVEDKKDKGTLEKDQNDTIKKEIEPINIEQITEGSPAIKTLINSQIKDESINIISSIITLIKDTTNFKVCSNEDLEEKLNDYIKEKRNEIKINSDIKNVEITEIKEISNISPIKRNMAETEGLLSSIAEEDKKKNVYDRLYEQRKKFEVEIKEEKPKPISTSLSKKSEKYFTKLYNDSKKPKPTHKIKTIQVKTNSKSNSILFNRFKNQFNECLNNISLNDLKNKDYLNYEQLSELLGIENLGFLSGSSSSQEVNLFDKMFILLQVNGYIFQENLFVFCLGILGLLNCYQKSNNGNISTPQNHSIASTTTSTYVGGQLINVAMLPPSTYFNVNNNIISITQSQSIIIAKEFINFSNNWKQNLISKNKKLQVTQNTFKPITNIKYNSKIKGNLFSHIKQFQNRQKSKEKLTYEAKELKEKLEMKNCTFTPKITSSSSKSKYRLAITPTRALSREKSRDEIEYETNKGEYTFMPKINKYTKQRPKTNESSFTSYDEQMYINRMKKGRIEQERINQSKELRNYAIKSSSNLSTNFNQCILVIDISINEELKRLYVHKNDKPEEVVKHFVAEHKLQEPSIIEQVKEIIYNEMKNAKYY